MRRPREVEQACYQAEDNRYLVSPSYARKIELRGVCVRRGYQGGTATAERPEDRRFAAGPGLIRLPKRGPVAIILAPHEKKSRLMATGMLP